MGLLHQHPLHQTARLTGLPGDQPGADQLIGMLFDGLQAVCHQHAAGLAPAAGMDLRLHHPGIAIQLLGHRQGLFAGVGDTPLRHRNAIAAKQLFGLIFMYVHCLSSA